MTSPIASFSGIASGIDSASLIRSLVQLAQAPITQLEDQKSANAAQSKKLTDIRTKLVSLQNAAKALDTRREALLNSATTSDENVVKVSAAGGSTLGDYAVEVLRLARAERTYSDAVAGPDTAGLFGAGTLTIQVGEQEAVQVEIDAEDTLSSVAAKINASGAKVTAGLFYDGSSYRLQVSGNETGAENAVSFTESAGLTLGLEKPENEVQSAANAVIKLDGFTVESASNSITGAIPGVTLEVLGEGTSTVQVKRDPSALKAKLDAFVSAYNDVAKALNAEFTYTGVARGRDSLSGDGTLRGVQVTLRTLVSQGSEGAFANLAAIGISVQRDGTLALNTEKLNEACAQDYEGVAALLAADGGGGVMGRLSEAISPFVQTDGSLRTKIDNLSSRNRSIDQQIDRMQVRIDKYEEQLRRQFAALESMIGGMSMQGQALIGIMNGI